MKMKPEHYEQLRDSMIPILHGNPTAWNEYKQKGLSKHRFCWDVLWATKPSSINQLYSYLDDANITTALMKICSPFMV